MIPLYEVFQYWDKFSDFFVTTFLLLPKFFEGRIFSDSIGSSLRWLTSLRQKIWITPFQYQKFFKTEAQNFLDTLPMRTQCSLKTPMPNVSLIPPMFRGNPKIFKNARTSNFGNAPLYAPKVFDDIHDEFFAIPRLQEPKIEVFPNFFSSNYSFLASQKEYSALNIPSAEVSWSKTF